MKALCIKDTLGFTKGNEYHICPTLGGYQVTNENDITFGFIDAVFYEYFEIIK